MVKLMYYKLSIVYLGLNIATAACESVMRISGEQKAVSDATEPY